MRAKLATLVLAGTGEARQVIDRLAHDPAFDLTASLAGATQAPASLAVPVHSGGFGGADGLARFCRSNDIKLILDITHPFARVISRNAAIAASISDIPCLHYERPAWQPGPDDHWQSFDSWQEMAGALASGARVFLAGGTQSIEVFQKRLDIKLWARALNVSGRTAQPNVTFINAMPQTSISAEAAYFGAHKIDLICCKNSGGDASFAKIAAARQLGLPVWMLARHAPEKTVSKTKIYDKVETLIAAAQNLAQNLAQINHGA